MTLQACGGYAGLCGSGVANAEAQFPAQLTSQKGQDSNKGENCQTTAFQPHA